MGGKQKQAQRVKNNARPSNSGRSAEFLGTTIPPFSFNAIKETGFSANAFSLTPIDVDLDASVDSNFQVVLKKMNKKDATTKLKALQEFTELVRNTESEAVKAILPFWPRLYAALATDAEHRVREATHIAQNQVVLKAKRNLAPYLKQLAGPWFTSQYDTYAPASCAASRAFKDAFPINKLQEAIIFCQEEILNYICDNLIVHTAQTLSNPKTTTADDSKAKYERVVISSLQGYSLYLKQVPEDAIRKVDELNKRIISNNKFWKLARNDVPQIRSSWFSVLAVICEKAGFLLEGEGANAVKAVFGNLDESDPIVQSNLWEAALLTTRTIPEWWNFYNVEEKLLPKLWKVLREAGHGNATVIYPNLLPLISHLPVTLNNEEFLPKFFDNMKTGLRKTSAKTSQSESRAISVAFIECLQYSIMKNHENADLCQNLVKDHLIPLLDASLLDTRAAHKTLFNQVSSLVQYWHKNKFGEYPNYAKLLNVFWLECEKLFSLRITEYAATESGKVVSELSCRQIDLLVSLKHTIKPKQLKVQFTTEDDHRKSERRDSKTHTNPEQSYLDALHCFVYNICVFYIKVVDHDADKKLPDMIENVVALAQEFESEAFVRHLKQEFCGGSDADSMLLFNLVFNWIKSPVLCRKNIVDLVFLLLKYASEEETAKVLESFIHVSNKEALGWCITRALSHPHNTEPVIQTWLGNEKIGEFLVNIAKCEIEDSSTSDLSLLLKQAFTETNDNGNLFITKPAVEEILKALSNCIVQPFNYTFTIDNCASLSSYIASCVYTETPTLTYSDELFLALFTLTCNVKESDCAEFLSKDTLWEVKTAWQDALATIAAKSSKDDLLALTDKCAAILEKFILNSEIADHTESATEVITKFLLSVERSKPQMLRSVLKLFFERDFVVQWNKHVFSLRQQVEYFKGQLCLPNLTRFDVVDIEDGQILKYFSWKLLVIKTLLTGTEDDEEDVIEDVIEDDTEEEKSPNHGSNHIIHLFNKCVELVLELLQDLVTFDSILTNYTHLKYYGNLCDLNKIFRVKFNDLLNALLPTVKNMLETALQEKVKSASWAIPAYTYFVQMTYQDPPATYRMLSENCDSLSRMYLTQAFSKRRYVTYDDVEQRIKTLEAIVTLRCLMHCDDIDVQIAEVYGCIEKLKNQDMELKFYNVQFSNWEQMQIIIEIIRLCKEMLTHKKTACLTRRHWDFVVVSLGSWSGKLADAKTLYTNPQVASFIAAICDLYIAVKDHINELRLVEPNSAYVDEWENVFVKSITADLVRTWLYLSEKFVAMEKVPTNLQPFLQEFGKVIQHLQPKYVFDCRIDGMPKWSKLLKQCCALLTSPVHSLQLWGYHMLKVLSFGLIQVDAIAVDTNTPHEKGLIFEQFKDLLVETHNIVSTMLQDFKLGEDSCRVEPFTDSYTYTFAYLLLWDVLLHLCNISSTELRYQYSDWLRKEDLLNSLLSSIFKLMPLEVFQSETKLKTHNWFVHKATLDLNEPITSEKIERLDCSVYSSTLAQLPATVRQWWSNAETRTSQFVERVTSLYISPDLCTQELTAVSEHENNFKNLIIKVHSSVREVVAVYTVDEAQMELIITLPINYPLFGPDVQCNRQIGGLPHKQWLMQLRMCVLHQNGRIWDALSLWNNNLDKKFDGVEECYICFAVLHPGTYQLPKLSCKTCRKKFHAACLYKWFSTSNKSTCPICRNLF